MKPGQPAMTDRERELFLSILAGYPNIHAVLTPLYFLDSYIPKRMLVPALTYLKRNGLIGATFHAWYSDVCNGSPLKLAETLLKKITSPARLA